MSKQPKWRFLETFVLNLEHSIFGFVSYFVLRISDFSPSDYVRGTIPPVSSKNLWDMDSLFKGGWGDFHGPFGIFEMASNIICENSLVHPFGTLRLASCALCLSV